jgi:hypothetical protein
VIDNRKQEHCFYWLGSVAEATLPYFWSPRMQDPTIREAVGIGAVEILAVLAVLLLPATVVVTLLLSLPKAERRIVVRSALFGGLAAISFAGLAARVCTNDVRVGDAILLLLAVSCGMKACLEVYDDSNSLPRDSPLPQAALKANGSSTAL